MMKIKTLEKNERDRPSWDDMFLIEAMHWSSRSHDTQTKCGCVIVDQHNTVLSTGYNGFIRGVDDSVLPTTRPDKYNFMVHAEHNAILNCVRQGRSTLGATAYITGPPCTNCLQYLYQAGIKKIVYTDFNKIAMLNNTEYIERFRLLLHLMKDMDIIFKSCRDICSSSLEYVMEKLEKTQKLGCQNQEKSV